MSFIDQKLLLQLLKEEVTGSKLVFQVVDSSVLSFSTNIPIYLNPISSKSSSVSSKTINATEHHLL
ncbi:MAG: hypothetical protein COT84_07285 [Chlamydiae bacterium CG10_big_fil_rev_8_21_14_0_10_35_9]|nr:MAG: hypothetical protein COT84_07285 [Chlamydiae bacterium CG10_big_fil_rev_8_21_14_0_10_35_9]